MKHESPPDLQGKHEIQPVKSDLDEPVSVTIAHRIPDGLPLTFIDNIVVQHTATEFTITFAQVRQPLIYKDEDYQKLESLQADVMARIILTPTKMAEFINLLQDNWKIYQRRVKALMEAKNVSAVQSDAGTTEGSTSKD